MELKSSTRRISFLKLKNIVLRIFSFAISLLLLRFAYVISINGGGTNFCFFPDKLELSSDEDTVTRFSSLPDLWTSKKWRRSVDYYTSVFQDLIYEGYLSTDSKSLCIQTLTGEDVFALREIGVVDSIGSSMKASSPLVVAWKGYHQPFDENVFDFVFCGGSLLDRSLWPMDLVANIHRTLKVGGYFVVHIAGIDRYSFNSFLELLDGFRLLGSRDIEGLDFPLIREIVVKKETKVLEFGKLGVKCALTEYKRELIGNVEPLIIKEPLQPWVALKRNIRNVKYLSSMVKINFKRRYVYIDVGARSYGSSIGSWFKKQYPKQNKTFEIYAIEADKTFHSEYKMIKGVTLLPYEAWIKNETLFFGITRQPNKTSWERNRGIGRIQHVHSSSNYMGDVNTIQGIDFADWLKSVVSKKDFVVIKMDVEGTEFHLIPRLIETGAICLLDEIFLECHYDRWEQCCPGERSLKYQKTYAQCLELFSSLREKGVLVHQWW